MMTQPMTPYPPSESLPVPSTVRSGWPWTIPNKDKNIASIASHDSPKITVVTPSFNQAPFLEETIRSVLLQGYPNLEYIIMDGGSTDGSVEIIRKYEPWLTYWQSERDGGQAEAINNGWKRSTGYAITWLNSDDVLTPDSLMTSVQVLAAKDGPDMVYGDNTIIDENSTIHRRLAGRPFLPKIFC
jgi:glycosyltransferase involved in cell wall biosynthesis